MKHGQGISVDQNGNMYEGQFQLGKKHGRGRLTKIPQPEQGQTEIQVIEGVWENDIFAYQTGQESDA